MEKSELSCKEGRDLPPLVHALGPRWLNISGQHTQQLNPGHGTNTVVFCMFQVFCIIKKYTPFKNIQECPKLCRIFEERILVSLEF